MIFLQSIYKYYFFSYKIINFVYLILWLITIQDTELHQKNAISCLKIQEILCFLNFIYNYLIINWKCDNILC